MTPIEPVCRDLEATLMRGRMKGAKSEKTNRVTVSVILSISFSKPGIFSTIELMRRTTLSLNSRIG